MLQRVGVLSIRGKRHLKPLDLTRVVFSDEKFFRWNHQRRETCTKEISIPMCASTSTASATQEKWWAPRW